MLEQEIKTLNASINKLIDALAGQSASPKKEEAKPATKAETKTAPKSKPKLVKEEPEVETVAEEEYTADDIKRLLTEVSGAEEAGLGRKVTGEIIKDHGGGEKLFSKIDKARYPAIARACKAKLAEVHAEAA